MPLAWMKFTWRWQWRMYSFTIGTSGHVYPAAGFVHEATAWGTYGRTKSRTEQVGSEFEEKYYGPASQVGLLRVC